MARIYLRAPSGKVFVPEPPQEAFLGDNDSFARAFIGGKGAGKTLTNAMECLLTALENPGSVGLIGRLTYPELAMTTWKTLMEIVPKCLVVDHVCSQIKTELVLRAPNGKTSTIIGRSLGDWRKLSSLNLDWASIDEVTELPNEEVFEELIGRLRRGVGPHRIWCSGTPNGRDWVWKQFVQRGLSGYKVYKAKTSDNPHNPVGYEERQRQSLSKEKARRFLDADFDVQEGLILWMWDEGVHVIPSYEPQPHQPIFCAIDPGLSDACASLLLTTDESGTIVVFRELYKSGLTISQQCEAIRTMIGSRKVEWFVIDPVTRSRSDVNNRSRLDLYRENGLPVTPGNNDVDASIGVLEDLLRVSADRKHILTGEYGAPGLYVARDCVRLREEISGWQWGRNGKPKDGADHAISCLRYACLRRPHPAPPITTQKRLPAFEGWWRAIAAEASGRSELPKIGAGERGTLAL